MKHFNLYKKNENLGHTEIKRHKEMNKFIPLFYLTQESEIWEGMNTVT